MFLIKHKPWSKHMNSIGIQAKQTYLYITRTYDKKNWLLPSNWQDYRRW